jgi:hypothetical protein
LGAPSLPRKRSSFLLEMAAIGLLDLPLALVPQDAVEPFP